MNRLTEYQHTDLFEKFVRLETERGPREAIANVVETAVAEAIKALDARLRIASDAAARAFTASLCVRAVRGVVSQPASDEIAANEILADVSREYGTTPSKLVSHARPRSLVEPRQVAVLLLTRAGFGVTRIGAVMRRDHSTICHSLAQAQNSTAVLAVVERMAAGQPAEKVAA